MAVHALTEVEVDPGQEREALWAAARLGRRLARHMGFRGWRVFRSDTASETLLVLSEWEAWEALTAAEESASLVRLLDPLRARCRHWRERRLEPLFQLELPRRRPGAGVAQGIRIETDLLIEASERQKTFGLRAMALPGTIGVMGGQCLQETGFFFCAVEFETEAAQREFLGSAAWHEWTRSGVSTLWSKEGRLEVRGGPRTMRDATHRRSEELGSLSVHLESSPDGATVRLRLSGCLDEIAAERLERVGEAIMSGHCRTLTLDVSDLVGVSPTGLKHLLATARQVKSAGGQFSLVDRQGRYDHILRVWHLNQAIAAPTAPRRRQRPVRLPTPGKA